MCCMDCVVYRRQFTHLEFCLVRMCLIGILCELEGKVKIRKVK